MIKTCATLNYSEALVTVGSYSYWKLHCSPLTVIGWLAACILGILWHLVVLHSCWAYLLSTWGRSLVRSFTGSACEACFAAMKMSIRKCMSWYVFAFGVEFSNFHQNLVTALHCHDNWGFTSLSTLISRFLVIFLYLFLNILCGIFSGVCLFKFGLVFLKWWSWFDYKCYQGIKMYESYLSPNPSTDAIVNNSVHSA